MVKFLGILDILAAGILVAVAYDLAIAQGLIIAFAVYLFLKAIIFLKDIGSLFDVIAAILLVLSFFTAVPQIVFFVFEGLVGLKGLMSLFAS